MSYNYVALNKYSCERIAYRRYTVYICVRGFYLAAIAYTLDDINSATQTHGWQQHICTNLPSISSKNGRVATFIENILCAKIVTMWCICTENFIRNSTTQIFRTKLFVNIMNYTW